MISDPCYYCIYYTIPIMPGNHLKYPLFLQKRQDFFPTISV